MSGATFGLSTDGILCLESNNNSDYNLGAQDWRLSGLSKISCFVLTGRRFSVRVKPIVFPDARQRSLIINGELWCLAVDITQRGSNCPLITNSFCLRTGSEDHELPTCLSE